MGNMDWIDLAQNGGRWRAVVNAVMNLRVTSNTGNFLTSWEPVSFLRRDLLHSVIKGLGFVSLLCFCRRMEQKWRNVSPFLHLKHNSVKLKYQLQICKRNSLTSRFAAEFKRTGLGFLECRPIRGLYEIYHIFSCNSRTFFKPKFCI
jgi:hypothetical protein